MKYLEKTKIDENQENLIESGGWVVAKPECDEEADERDQWALETCLPQLCSL